MHSSIVPGYGLGSELPSPVPVISRAHPNPLVSTFPHASLPPRTFRPRTHIGLQPQGFIPTHRAGQGGVMLERQ
jgi:hypothetical protein